MGEELSGEKVKDMRKVKEGRKSPKPKAVEQYENLVSSKIKGDQKYDHGVTEKRNAQNELTLKIEELEDNKNQIERIEKCQNQTEISKFENKIFQKSRVGEDNDKYSKVVQETSFPLARRWNDVNTGYVKDRSSVFKNLSTEINS